MRMDMLLNMPISVATLVLDLTAEWAPARAVLDLQFRMNNRLSCFLPSSKLRIHGYSTILIDFFQSFRSWTIRSVLRYL